MTDVALIARLIDHALLHPALTDAEMTAGCHAARGWQVAAVCIKPCFLPEAVKILAGSIVKPTTTIGFPHGATDTASKIAESKRALADGAVELDMVVNIGKVLSEDWAYVEAEIAAVCELIHASGHVFKVIFENSYLKDHHKIRLCEICSTVGVDYIKTSTGYGSGGATMGDLRLMLKNAPGVQVKASGGIRTLPTVLAMRDLGVSRFGTGNTREILLAAGVLPAETTLSSPDKLNKLSY